MERNSATALAALIGIILALVIGLHRVGTIPELNVDWGNPIVWVETSAPEVAVGAFLRQVGLIVGYWALTTTVLYAIARALKAPTPWARFLMLPVARRLVDRAVATSLAVSLLGSPLIPTAEAEPPVVFEVSGDGIPVPHVRVIEPPEPDRAIPPLTTDPEADRIPNPPPSGLGPISPMEPPLPTEASHIVAKGDNLWTIAAAHLATAGESPTSSKLLGEYWRRVIEHNQATLRSGDPNLIYPGEVIALPPVGDAS